MNTYENERLVIQLNFNVGSAPKLEDLLMLEDLEDGLEPVLCAGFKGDDDIWRYYPCVDVTDKTFNVIGKVIAWAEKPTLQQPTH